MRLEGLEPPRLATPEPKSGVSTNFTTAAAIGCRVYSEVCSRLTRLLVKAFYERIYVYESGVISAGKM